MNIAGYCFNVCFKTPFRENVFGVSETSGDCAGIVGGVESGHVDGEPEGFGRVNIAESPGDKDGWWLNDNVQLDMTEMMLKEDNATNRADWRNNLTRTPDEGTSQAKIII